LRIRSREDLRRAEDYSGVTQALLLDAWVPGQLGGTGQAIPLAWLEGFSPAVPWWLAGGLTPETVRAVLRVCRPYGLDVSSGVEDRPGWKNLDRVAELISQVQDSR
jgi:phosphoribosylanthranilate isomerase